MPPLRRYVHAGEQHDVARALGARKAQGPRVPPMRRCVRQGKRPDGARARSAPLAPHCAAVALVAGRGGEDEEQAEDAEGSDARAPRTGPVTVKAFSVDTREHLVVG